MKETDDQAQILLDSMPHAIHSQDNALVVTILISLLISVVLGYAAYRGKQSWLLIWSIGLFIASIVFAAVFLFEL